jgi:DNA polymerase delta subunit 2
LAPPNPETQKIVKNKFGRLVTQFDPVPLENLDDFISGIVSGIDVHIMPGPNDPTTHLLPQRPIHHSLLNKSNKYSTMHSVSNPFLASVAAGKNAKIEEEGTEILCTSGQIVDDIYKYVPTKDRLGIATAVIGCGIVSPTSPDTLWTSPSNEDTFVMKRIPHLFVVGNQPEFQTKLLAGSRGSLAEKWAVENGEENAESTPLSMDIDSEDQEICRVILVPKFKETGMVVLVRLDTLDCKVVQFSKKITATHN